MQIYVHVTLHHCTICIHYTVYMYTMYIQIDMHNMTNNNTLICSTHKINTVQWRNIIHILYNIELDTFHTPKFKNLFGY